MSGDRMAMKCLHETDTMKDGTVRFIPCAVIENEAGYRPMRGADELTMAWYWGETHEECQAHCDSYNEDMGLTPEDVMEIVSSSMRLSFT